MRFLRFLFSAAIIECLGIGLAAWLFLANPFSSADERPAKSWSGALQVSQNIPEPAQREKLVEAKLVSTADRISALVSQHFNQLFDDLFTPPNRNERPQF